MTEWLITQKPTFLTELLALPPKESHQVQSKLSLLAQDPTPDGKIKKQLKNWTPPLYRLRCGDYRIFYAFHRPYISLLALRRRSEDTYDEDIESESLGGFAPEPTVRVPNSKTDWADILAKQPATLLPSPIDLRLLQQLHVPEQYHVKLQNIKTQEELLGCKGVPDEILLRLDEAIFERPIKDVMEQPDLISDRVDDLFRFKEGNLAGFLLKLTPEQERLVTLNLAGGTPTLVKGGPGSGKSTVALYRAAALARRLEPPKDNQPSPILFTTYTNALVSFSRGLLRALLGNRVNCVEIATADSIVGKILSNAGRQLRPASQGQLLDAVRRARQPSGIGTNALERMRSRATLNHITDEYLIEEITSVIESRGINSVEDYLVHPRAGREEPLDAEQRRLIWQIKQAFERTLNEHKVQTWSRIRLEAARVARTGGRQCVYDEIIIDEAQDLEPAALNVLLASVRNPVEIFLTADANQSIYRTSFRWSEVHEQLELSGVVGMLSANFRSTREIALAAHSYLKTATIDADVIEQRFVHEGSYPVMRKVRTHDDETVLLERFIRGASREFRVTIGSAAVLCPSAREGERLASALTTAGLSATFMLSKDLDVDAPGVKVLPLRAAKGLEFPIVAIAGLWPPYPFFPTNANRGERDERSRLERRTLYVGMTRAMRALLVVVPEGSTSTILEGFDRAFWNLSA